jgi:hypothetical protein
METQTKQMYRVGLFRSLSEVISLITNLTSIMIQFRSIIVVCLLLFSSMSKCHGLGGKESTVLVDVCKDVGQQTTNHR